MGRQLNATQPLAHISPTPSGMAEEEGKVKAGQLVGQDKNCLISEGEVEERKKENK